MKWVRNVLGILIILACAALLPVQSASAETFVVEGGSIRVQTKVLDTHYVLIDAHDQITQITSNSTQKAQPRVFLDRVAPGNERPMTDGIYRQYHSIVPTGQAQVGTIYKRSEIARLPLFSATATYNKPDLLAFIKQ